MTRPPNQEWFDRYSVVHFAVGAVFQASSVPAPYAIGAHVLFEASENSFKEAMAPIWPDARPDGAENHIGDVASFASGYFASQALRGTRPGQLLVICAVAAGAAIWTHALLNRQLWRVT